MKQLLLKIAKLAEENRTYTKLNKKKFTKEEYEKKVIEEANIRKMKAKRVILSHSIGSAIVRTIPLVDLVVQNLFIKTTAVKKLGQNLV